MSGASAQTAPLPDDAYTVALCALPDLWGTRLAALLAQRRADVTSGAGASIGRTGAEAWAMVLDGSAASDAVVRRACGDRVDDVIDGWRVAAANLDVADLWERYRRAGITLRLLGRGDYPRALAGDARAPRLLFCLGDPAAVEGPRVALIGTRQATISGREIAFRFGRELAAAGARVVSGLALGIDAAAHAGALSAAGAPPVGVVAGGLDRPYPSRHRSLWQQVAARGVLLGEAPLGTPHEGWRFPARNRIIAALADVVVVVESHVEGGSMITARLALERGIRVMAVPGPITSPASAGTNRLFRDGAGPACDTADVLAALELDLPGIRAGGDPRPPPGPSSAAVLAAVDWAPTPTERILARTGLGFTEIASALIHLEIDGWVRASGGWWERLAPPAAE